MSNIVPFDFDFDEVLAVAVELPGVKIERRISSKKFF